jgi:putative membrane protein
MGEGDQPAKPSSEEYRLRLQMETTLLVWVRTSLALMGFGFVVARFGLFLREVAEVGNVRLSQHPRLASVSTVAGTAVIGLGVCSLLIAAVAHYRDVGRLERGELRLPPKFSRGVLLSLLLAALGMALAVYLTLIEL